MKRFVFAAWAIFIGALAAITFTAWLAGETGPAPEEALVPAGPRAVADLGEFTGTGGCIGCHRGVHAHYRDTHHTSILGPTADIHPTLLERWDALPDPQGNPVVFDENEPAGIAGTRDLELDDGVSLPGVAAVYVRHEGQRQFSARFLDPTGSELHRRDVSPYHVGAKYRQALAVNIGDGAGTRLLKYQYSFDDGAHQHTWRDRNQARIYEKNCIGCHVSGFDLFAFEADRSLPIEDFTADLGVGCESCHGPGRAHAAAPRAPGLIVNPVNLTIDQQVHLCAQCHVRGTSTVHEGRQDSIDFRPGDSLLDHFRPVPVEWGVGTARVAADGKAAASRQQFMDHYLGTKANLPCTTCHAMHAPDTRGALLRSDILGVCASCHGDAYPDPPSVRAVMDGLRGWDDPAWRGWRTQHTFRLDDDGRVIGLPEANWPAEGGWPWDSAQWQWDFRHDGAGG